MLGRDGQWIPLSLDPEATRRSMLALVPGLAMFVAGIFLSPGNRFRIALMLVGFAAFGAILGAIQAASGGGFTPFASVHHGHALGLFTNRNHQAIFLLIAMLMTAALGRRPFVVQPLRLVAFAGLLLFAAAVIATKSRTGSVLLIAMLPSAIVMLFRLRLGWRTVAIGVGVLAGMLLVVAFSAVGEALIERFGFAGDDRLNFWSNSMDAVRAYWPLGSGFGSFPLVYQSVEPLGSMTGSYVNHAHNDYLEFALEGGAPAILLLLAGLAFMAARAGRAIPRSGLAIAAFGAVLILLLHSLVDYPLRMLSLEAVFGFVCALLLVPSEVTE
jgi:O-antigen ligase